MWRKEPCFQKSEEGGIWRLSYYYYIWLVLSAFSSPLLLALSWCKIESLNWNSYILVQIYFDSFRTGKRFFFIICWHVDLNSLTWWHLNRTNSLNEGMWTEDAEMLIKAPILDHILVSRVLWICGNDDMKTVIRILNFSEAISAIVFKLVSVCIRAKWPIRPELTFGFCNMKRLEVLLPRDETLGHLKFADTRLFTWAHGQGQC